MKRGTSEQTFFKGIAALCAVGALMAAFIAGVYVEQALWGLPDRVNFKQCLPWFVVFSLAAFYFSSALDFFRSAGQTAFSALVSIILINLGMMALPFFEVLYYIQVSTLFVVVIMECGAALVWMLVMRGIFKRLNPPSSTVVLCRSIERGEAVAAKINLSARRNRADAVLLYTQPGIFGRLKNYDAVALIDPPEGMRDRLAMGCWSRGQELIIIPGVYDLVLNNASFIQFDDVVAYKARPVGLSAQQRAVKRAMDLLGSALALIFLSPLFLLIALIVRRDGGPVFYRQKRVTRQNREFNLYKFRTMVVDAEKHTGPTLAEKDDPRVTRAGRWLRSTRLDELPQFVNVLRGDMSLVGPRPEREYFIDEYLKFIPEYRYRTIVRAGITGLAHVQGKYSTTPEERIKLDLTYIQNYSLFLDLKILLETVRVVLLRENAEGVAPRGEEGR